MERNLREDFPIFTHHPELIYLDNAATSQKPQCVIDAICNFYAEANAPAGRSTYRLARQADRAYRDARQTLGQFIGAQTDEVVFTKSATESANIIARSFALPRLFPQNNIVVTAMEHNSNLLPWAEICRERGAELRIVELNPSGIPDLTDFDAKADENTVLAACSCASNVLGNAIPYPEIAALCRQKGIPLALDATQLAAHHPLDVGQMGCDFLFFSGHKMYGPTGAGILYAHKNRLQEMNPFLTGGGMIDGDDVTRYASGFQRFEAGTPDVAARIGLAAAVEYLGGIGWDALQPHERHLAQQMQQGFRALERYGIRLLGNPAEDAAVFSFVCPGVHPFDLACLLNGYGIAVRSGKMCAQTLFQRMNCAEGCVRASLALYNTSADIAAFFTGLEAALKKLQRR